LADYQSHRQAFEQEKVGLLALSVDPLDKAKETVDQLKLDFPVAYGLEIPRDADKIGAYWEERRKIFHATNRANRCRGRIEPHPFSQKESAINPVPRTHVRLGKFGTRVRLE